ncbi:MAG: hypothetical protein QY332_13630 [Anaerolineales bacterium]|nr:MAG: hypothetical protein QY332_13630 [Anaerolineales bacterium]
MSDQEQERLRRLRERQLQSRDPLTKQRTFQRTISVKEKRMRKPFSFAKAWKDIPQIIKVPFYGLILGVAVIFVLPLFWDSPFAIYAGAGAALLFMIFGMILGNSLDLRDDIRKHLQ